MKIKKLNFVLFIIMMGFLMNSCSNDDATSTHPIAINMTDAPGPYDKVFVDLQGVEVTGSGGQTVLLHVKKGIYNLLDFSNGVSTLIATDTMAISKVEQIRLILGTNNSIVLNNVSYPLSTPSADQSGLKLQVHQTLQQNILYSVLLDFDANKSIVDLGNGSYKLKPVIRTVEAAISGSITGSISPTGLAVVNAINIIDPTLSFSTSINANGKFTVMGLSPGTYNLIITLASPLLAITKSSIVVTAGLTTDVGTVML